MLAQGLATSLLGKLSYCSMVIGVSSIDFLFLCPLEEFLMTTWWILRE